MAELPFQNKWQNSLFKWQNSLFKGQNSVFKAGYKHPGMISQGGKKNNLYQASPPPPPPLLAKEGHPIKKIVKYA
jgi:hypothetical protein